MVERGAVLSEEQVSVGSGGGCREGGSSWDGEELGWGAGVGGKLCGGWEAEIGGELEWVKSRGGAQGWVGRRDGW